MQDIELLWPCFLVCCDKTLTIQTILLISRGNGNILSYCCLIKEKAPKDIKTEERELYETSFGSTAQLNYGEKY